MSSITARCGRTDEHGAHVIDRGESGDVHGWCAGNRNVIVGRPASSAGQPFDRAESHRVRADNATGEHAARHRRAADTIDRNAGRA